MSYRNDLDAAHARITALERELAAAKEAEKKPLRCARCGTPVELGNLDIRTGAATCPSCRRVTDASLPPPTRRGAPRGLEVSESSDRLRIAWNWDVSFAELLGAVITLGLVIWSLVKMDDPPIAVVASAWFLGAFGVWLLLRVVAQILNQTNVEVRGGRLTIDSKPFGRRYELVGSEIAQLYCTMATSKHSAWYALHALMRDGERLPLIDEVPEAERAFYLERELERRLGIADAPVAGEVARR